jgi:hypothetical protein
MKRWIWGSDAFMGGTQPSQMWATIGTLAVGDQVVVDIPTFRRPDQGEDVEGLTHTVYFDYKDIGGLPFNTAMHFYFGDDPPATLNVSVTVAEGSYANPFYIQKPMTMHMWRRRPLRWKLRNAATKFFLVPGEPMRPLRPRVGEAWREIFPPKQQSYLQRLRLAIRARPEHHPRFDYEYKNVKGGFIARPLRRTRISLAVKANTFLKRREGF